MNFDVFISYPHQDKATADAACAMLERAGLRCWIAPRDVPYGAEWAAAIVAAIDHCLVMVLIFSSNANESKQICREVQMAFDKGVPVMPLRIENIAPESSLAYYMGPVHWLDALTPPLEQHLQKLAVSVRAFVQEKRAGEQRKGERARKRPLGGFVFVAAILVTTLVGFTWALTSSRVDPPASCNDDNVRTKLRALAQNQYKLSDDEIIEYGKSVDLDRYCALQIGTSRRLPDGSYQITRPLSYVHYKVSGPKSNPSVVVTDWPK